MYARVCTSLCVGLFVYICTWFMCRHSCFCTSVVVHFISMNVSPRDRFLCMCSLWVGVTVWEMGTGICIHPFLNMLGNMWNVRTCGYLLVGALAMCASGYAACACDMQQSYT